MNRLRAEQKRLVRTVQYSAGTSSIASQDGMRWKSFVPTPFGCTCCDQLSGIVPTSGWPMMLLHPPGDDSR